jgi:hypothetical protein
MSAKEMGRRLGHTHGYVYAIKAKYGIHTPPEIISGFLKNSHYKKGNIPANKGIPMSAWMAPENIEKINELKEKIAQMNDEIKKLFEEIKGSHFNKK